MPPTTLENDLYEVKTLSATPVLVEGQDVPGTEEGEASMTL